MLSFKPRADFSPPHPPTTLFTVYALMFSALRCKCHSAWEKPFPPLPLGIFCSLPGRSNAPRLGTLSWLERHLSSPAEHVQWTSVLDSAHHSLQTFFSCLNFQFSKVCFVPLCFGACLSFCKFDFGLLKMRGSCNRSENAGHMEWPWWLL